MKVIFNKEIVKGPWGGGNQMLALFANYLTRRKHEVYFDLSHVDEADFIVIMDAKESSCSFGFDDLLKAKNNNRIKVIHRVNDNGRHRSNGGGRTDEQMLYVNRTYADKTIFISKWLKNYYEERGMTPSNATMIHNGTDRGLFFPGTLTRGENDPLRIITHHWSKNSSKGYDVYEKLGSFCSRHPDVATFTFMGNPNECLKNATIISPKPYKEIPQYLRQYDVYVTATRFESGGCHIVEGMACGLVPIVRIGGGGTEEYSYGFNILYNDVEDLLEYVVRLRNNYDLFMEYRNKILEYSYGVREMCEKYIGFLDQ